MGRNLDNEDKWRRRATSEAIRKNKILASGTANITFLECMKSGVYMECMVAVYRRAASHGNRARYIFLYNDGRILARVGQEGRAVPVGETKDLELMMLAAMLNSEERANVELGT